MNIVQQILNEQSIAFINKTYHYANVDVHCEIWAIEHNVHFKIGNIRHVITKHLMEFKK